MRIISHRANIDGPNPSTENSLNSIERAFASGFGIETDIRFSKNCGFYISHNLADFSSATNAKYHTALWRKYNHCPVALNIKELGHENKLVNFLISEKVINQILLFDMELIERNPGETAKFFRQINPMLKLAARVSDRGESIDRALNIECADYIWLDEFDTLWATQEDIQRLKNSGKVVYAISPELHGFSMIQATQRWLQFLSWGVDGICTDWPIYLASELSKIRQEITQ